MESRLRTTTRRLTRDVVAVILAVGIATALNLITIGILYDAISDPANAGISENATQILTGWGGGIVGILGAVFGYEAGRSTAPDDRRSVDGGGAPSSSPDAPGDAPPPAPYA